MASSSVYGALGVLWSRSLARYPVLLLLDAVVAATSLVIAFALRFDGAPPEWVMGRLGPLVALLVASRLGPNLLFQLHRWSFRYAGLYDALRTVLATLLGSGIFLGTCFFIAAIPPRSVLVLEFFLTATLMAIFRFSPRIIFAFWAERRRSRRPDQIRAVIVGAGSAGELLLRDLRRSEEHSYTVIGFVDDDRGKRGSIIEGTPVLGAISDLPSIVAKHEVGKILIAIPRLGPERIREILSLCQNLKVKYKILPVSFAYLNDRAGAAMLQDLEPEDLLPRESIAFEESEIRALVKDRRALVTGAAGSIGSEIARQLCLYGARTVVLCDINENDLYFLYRDLREKHPELEIFAEVLDIRDASRVNHLGEKYLPQDVFHAAAHKHVPLMETAPSEAVKNNVAGTRNLARMADLVGVDRFVFISTDKAVNPTSVMGASKRVGEYVVRDMARRSRTHFAAVRFGNVLGSGGSVVPLFKKQIAKGGPVTVTHPDIRRYFMTIPEAVGLVLLSGLGRYGDLCILDMGEPIRILDLARHMISMSGHVPEVDIQIAFTGLRPGEKLWEDLMTEDEEQAQQARAKVFVVKSAQVPPDLGRQVEELLAVAEAENDEGVIAHFKQMIPTFRAHLAGGEVLLGAGDNGQKEQ